MARLEIKKIPGTRKSPLPKFIAPQLATLVKEPPSGDKWLHELKFDGYRMLCRSDRGNVQLGESIARSYRSIPWYQPERRTAFGEGRRKVRGTISTLVVYSHPCNASELIGYVQTDNTAASSAQLYWENNNNNFNAVEQKTADISIPVAVTVFPGEIYRAPKSWAERSYHKLIYFNEVDKGGHFAAWEQPELFAAELRAAFRSLR